VATAPSDEASSSAASSGDDFFSLLDEKIYLAQHTTWTIDRGSAQTYRVVAYGDSIYAGFQRSFGAVARRSAPWIAGEYFANATGANVEVVRRALTGGLASEVEGLIESDKSYMEQASTRAVYFEMCGNDYLQARKALSGQGGRCDYGGLDTALQTCITNTEKAMVRIAASATTATAKVATNLYYPGFDADNAPMHCTDPASAQRINMQDALLPYMARSNWRTCTLARSHGFACADSFAEFMGADADTNGDGISDVDGLRFNPSESEDDYVKRISVTVRSTIHDANHKGVTGAAAPSADYIFSDDVHPTVFGTATISSGGTGHGPPDFTTAQLTNGRNPQWNLFGHERMGLALWLAAPPTP
jgi:lysophospholipase L1-like esterase